MVTDVLDNQEIPTRAAGIVAFHQPPHSVRVLKIVDARIPAIGPRVTTEHPSAGNAGATLSFAAHSKDSEAVFSYHWDFGDGVTLEGNEVNHTYTQPGEYDVHLMATGLNGLRAEDHFQLPISGHMATTFDPQGNKRYQPDR
jgi:alpha-galactosidase